ncbi:hypothetical protein SODALDRAFT_360361 [Sodiomyces alkalinus F11]|uniref:Uncharacterized protein n=1 Tax=Sodiomyces alkalinus (strain CBS 110278 / VKM F-3762 / F11) TaxID=1314773 RepID=A0A3N2PUM5_SODAK|nr:hypothetical protein SODALDRAFT_360361 [Sodiomyces alkalinus F11]ROT38036.1 hypothetical protein SODALDRAFT_360361 [Sodiomyces alkalinus F11]
MQHADLGLRRLNPRSLCLFWVSGINHKDAPADATLPPTQPTRTPPPHHVSSLTGFNSSDHEHTNVDAMELNTSSASPSHRKTSVRIAMAPILHILITSLENKTDNKQDMAPTETLKNLVNNHVLQAWRTDYSSRITQLSTRHPAFAPRNVPMKAIKEGFSDDRPLENPMRKWQQHYLPWMSDWVLI